MVAYLKNLLGWKVIRVFFQFLKKPTPHVSGSGSMKQNLIEVLLLVGTMYGLALLISLLHWLLMSLGVGEEFQHFMYKQLEAIFAKEMWQEADWSIVLFAVVSAVWIAPFLEEVTFRLFLHYRLRNLLISLGLQLVFFLNQTGLSFNDSWMGFFITSFIVLLGMVVFWVMRQSRYQARLLQVWDRWFPFIFHYSAIAFGLVHYAAYGLEGSTWRVASLVLAPLFLMGLVLGFVRVRYGMWYAIGAHALINITSITIMLFTL